MLHLIVIFSKHVNALVGTVKNTNYCIWKEESSASATAGGHNLVVL